MTVAKPGRGRANRCQLGGSLATGRRKCTRDVKAVVWLSQWRVAAYPGERDLVPPPGNDTEAFDSRVEDDAGDATQRNFAYQHAYGAFLLLSALRGHFQYEAIWCEHHEDIVAERTDGGLEAFQVKTRDHGRWTNSDEPFQKALGTLTRARLALGGRIRALTFVSNLPVLETKSKQESERKKSPLILATSAAGCAALSELPLYLRKVVESLAKANGDTAEGIFETLRYLKFHRAWDRDSTDAQISAQLGYLPELQMVGTPSVVRRLASDMVARVYRASSLQCHDPAKFYGPLRAGGVVDPLLTSKRVSLAEIQLLIDDARGGDFRYPSSLDEVPGFVEAVRRSGGTRLRKKLVLARIPPTMIDTAAARATATLGRLLERQARDENAGLDLLHQLRHYVSAAYAESETAAIASGVRIEDAGPRLMVEMESRLRALAERSLSPLGGEPYETLSGVAAMLTEECALWWGPQRDLGEPHDD